MEKYKHSYSKYCRASGKHGESVQQAEWGDVRVKKNCTFSIHAQKGGSEHLECDR